MVIVRLIVAEKRQAYGAKENRNQVERDVCVAKVSACER